MKTIPKNLMSMLVALIFFCSCYEPIWVNPISDVQDAKIDKRLIGAWSEINDPGIARLHIYEIDQHSVYIIVFDEPRCPIYLEGHISEVDGRSFLNFRGYDCSTKEFSKYVISEYEFKGENEVTFHDLDTSFVRQAIRNKSLSGNMDEGLVVTATSQEIRDFIENSPKEELFDGDLTLVFKRFEGPKVTKKSICILF